MTIKLFTEAITKIFFGIALIGLLIFLPAGTLSFFNGWLLMVILFVPMLLSGFVMMFKCPKLLKKRLNTKENQPNQRLVLILSGFMFLSGFIVAGLGVRFQWYSLPKGVVFGASAVFLLAYLFYAEVIRENAYLSRIIEVQAGQKVIDTGVYGIIRHPMYSATIFLFLSMPLVLGSIYSFLIFLAYPFIIAMRIRSEEEFLEKELSGYREYKQKVKYRLIPFIW